VRLRLLNRVITNLFDDALRPLGVKISQLNIMVATAKLGLAQPARVCDLLQLDASTLSRNVERMRARGWLEVVPGEDARTQPFRLTSSGQKMLERAFPLWEKAQKKACELLGGEGVALLTRLESKIGSLPQ
jgi:DNA-binding MarR family transcriptional regulator